MPEKPVKHPPQRAFGFGVSGLEFRVSGLGQESKKESNHERWQSRARERASNAKDAQGKLVKQYCMMHRNDGRLPKDTVSCPAAP